MSTRASLFAVAIVVLSGALLRADEPDSIRNPTERGNARAEKEIVTIYDALVPLSYQEQRIALRNLDGSVRAKLWQLNLHRVRRVHPELTVTQNAVVEEALALLDENDFFAQNENNDQVHARFIMLRDAARSAFPVELLRALFIRFGPEPPARVMFGVVANPLIINAEQSAGRVLAKPNPNTYYDCDCIGWLECWYLDEKCVYVTCYPAQDCGFWGGEPCNGVCA